MDEIRLYKSPWKAITLMLLCLPFVVIGIFIISREPFWSTNYMMGWVSTLFFGLGILIGIVQLLDKKPQIVINESGLWDRSTKRRVIPWDQIEGAYLISLNGQKFISLELDESFEVKVKQYKWATWLNKAIGAQKVNLHLGQLKIDEKLLTEFIATMAGSDSLQRKGILNDLPNGHFAKIVPINSK